MSEVLLVVVVVGRGALVVTNNTRKNVYFNFLKTFLSFASLNREAVLCVIIAVMDCHVSWSPRYLLGPRAYSVTGVVVVVARVVVLLGRLVVVVVVGGLTLASLSMKLASLLSS